jgi:hypothetical protein
MPETEPGPRAPHEDNPGRTDRFPTDTWIEARCQPDLVLPVQFNDLTRRRRSADGELRLALAVLEDAVRTYVKGAPPRRRARGGKRFLEVSDWFESNASSPFSFEYICEVLGTNPDSLRRRLHTLTIEDFPTKQTHSVGRRHLMRPRKASRRSSTTGRPQSSPSADPIECPQTTSADFKTC